MGVRDEPESLGSKDCNNVTERAQLLNLYEELGGPGWTKSAGWGSRVVPHCDWDGLSCLYDCVLSIDLQLNNLTGFLPDNLDSFPKLRTINIFDNAISGVVPSSLARLKNLEKLDFSSNFFSGSIPPLHSLSRLNLCKLSDNQLTGFASSLGNLSYVRTLYAQRNRLSGPFPDLSGSPLLVTVDLSHNQLDGEVDLDRELPSNIEKLNLNTNKLSGNLPTARLLNKLQQFVVSYNHFSGTVASALTRESVLKFDIQHNHVSGFVPLVNSTSLYQFDVSYNDLSGSIPEKFFLGGQQLKFADFSHNKIAGTIPAFGTMDKLETLNLCCQATGLSGSIPPGYSMPALRYLDLSMNRLSGGLSSLKGFAHSPLASLNIRNNSLGGLLSEVSSLLGDEASQTLRVFNLQSNAIEGTIPDSVCIPFLINFDISDNMLTGTIPDCFGSLEYLSQAHFEQNNLHGKISKDGRTVVMPKSFENVTDSRGVYVEEKHYSCQAFAVSTSYAAVSLDPAYYDFVWCKCFPNFFGTVKEYPCRPCHPKCSCADGKSFVISEAVWLSPDPLHEQPVVMGCQNTSLFFNPCLAVEVAYPPNHERVYGSEGYPCAAGYVGRLCSRCQVNYFSQGLECVKCPAFFTWFMPLGYVVGAVCLIHFVLSYSASGISPESVAPIVVFSIQATSLLKDVQSIAWSKKLLTYFDLLSPFNFQVIGAQCIESFGLYEGLLGGVGGMLTPLVFCVFTLGIWAVGALFYTLAPSQSGNIQGYVRGMIFRCLYILLFFFEMNYMNVGAQALSVLTCLDDPSTGESYIQRYPWIPCRGPKYTKLLVASVIAIVFFMILVPVFFTVLVFHYRHQLHMPRVYSTLGFMYSSYTPRFYWWKFVIFARKALLLIAYFLPAIDTFVRPVFVFIVIQGSIIVQVNLKPYNTDLQNFVEVVALYCLQFTYLAGIIVQVSWVADSGGNVLCDFILMFNCLTMAYFAYALVADWPAVKKTRQDLSFKAKDTYKKYATKYYVLRATTSDFHKNESLFPGSSGGHISGNIQESEVAYSSFPAGPPNS